MRFATLVRRGIERPIVPLRVEAADGKWNLVDVLLDTGSDVTLFPSSLARYLGIDLAGVDESTVSSILGTQAAYRSWNVFLELRRPPDVLRWRATVGFVARQMNYGILGTRGFFEFFTLRYHAREHWIEIEPGGPLPM